LPGGGALAPQVASPGRGGDHLASLEGHARRLYLDSPDFPVEFQVQEYFTDIPKGSRRVVDILAKVWTIDETYETILIHSETQEDDRQDPDEKKMPFLDRMFLYSLVLQTRWFPMHVVPIVLWFVPNKGGVSSDTYDYRAMGGGLSLSYYRVCIPDLDAEEYLRKDNPLAYGLAARMKRGKLSKVRLSLACRSRIIRAPISDAEKTILLDFVNTYVKLNEKDEAEMQTILDSEPEYTDVKQSELTWLGKREANAAASAAAATRRGDLFDLCEVLNIDVSPDRKAKVGQLEIADLQRIWDHVKQHRAWPSE
jgi:hypothetical protein